MPVTFIEKVHVLFIASSAPVSDIAPDPAIAVIAPPAQVPVSPFGVATSRPKGRLSVNPTPVSGTVFVAGLIKVKPSVVLPPTGIDTLPNALIIAVFRPSPPTTTEAVRTRAVDPELV